MSITDKVKNKVKKVPIKKIYHLVNLRAKLGATESEGQMNDPLTSTINQRASGIYLQPSTKNRIPNPPITAGGAGGLVDQQASSVFWIRIRDNQIKQDFEASIFPQ
jgi:hypothetical protein